MLIMAGCSGSKEASSPSSPPQTVAPPSTPPSKGPSSPEAPPGPPPDAVTQLIQDALRTDGSVSYGDLVRRLGEPADTASEAIANTYDPNVVDTLRTLEWQGVEALVYDVSSEPRTFLIRLSVLSSRYASPEGLRVGDTQKTILNRIGPPTKRNRARGEWVYQESDATPTAMILVVKEGAIERIEWEFYFS